ncbi:MAG: hypothetical protein JWN74_1252 [Acidobacteriaceae bacterium]|nr:hypothetical protein [Acidobacteriaceae bacterium]
MGYSVLFDCTMLLVHRIVKSRVIVTILVPIAITLQSLNFVYHCLLYTSVAVRALYVVEFTFSRGFDSFRDAYAHVNVMAGWIALLVLVAMHAATQCGIKPHHQ